MLRPILVALLLAATPAHAQSLPDLGGAAEQAVTTLRDAAADRLLVGDLIGSEISGADGKTVGTVENLVAVPGGQLVAAIVATNDGKRLPVPYRLLKIDAAAEKAGVSLPVPLDELRDNAAVAELTKALGL